MLRVSIPALVFTLLLISGVGFSKFIVGVSPSKVTIEFRNTTSKVVVFHFWNRGDSDACAVFVKPKIATNITEDLSFRISAGTYMFFNDVKIPVEFRDEGKNVTTYLTVNVKPCNTKSMFVYSYGIKVNVISYNKPKPTGGVWRKVVETLTSVCWIGIIVVAIVLLLVKLYKITR